MEILIFRSCLVIIFFVAFLKLGDRRNWQRYYPTVLFVMVVNLAVSFITYHHSLWNYNPDILVKTQTTVELINSFFMLPTTTFIYLSRFPTKYTQLYQGCYIALWVFIYAILEFIDHYIVGGIFYTHGWAWSTSAIFDIAMFSIIRLHYSKPILAWGSSFLMTAAIIIAFNFMSGVYK